MLDFLFLLLKLSKLLLLFFHPVVLIECVTFHSSKLFLASSFLLVMQADIIFLNQLIVPINIVHFAIIVIVDAAIVLGIQRSLSQFLVWFIL